MSMHAAGRLAFAVVIVVVIGAVAGGLVVLGSPGAERSRRFDRRRVEDLRTLSGAVDRYWTEHKRLPDSLDALGQPGAPPVNLRDPRIGQPYEFHPGAPGKYDLCATFERATNDGTESAPGDFWWHGSGRQCFHLTPRDLHD